MARNKFRDFRIFQASTTTLKDGDFYDALVEPIWPSNEAEDSPEHLALGTPGQRALYATMLMARDVDNGGLEQALWNFEPWFIDLAVEGYERIGAHVHAATVREAIAAFFGNDVPLTLKARRRIIKAKARDWIKGTIEPLNERMYNEESLWPFWRRYVDGHEEEFYRPSG